MVTRSDTVFLAAEGAGDLTHAKARALLPRILGL